jgi:hypothetical protein
LQFSVPFHVIKQYQFFENLRVNIPAGLLLPDKLQCHGKHKHSQRPTEAEFNNLIGPTLNFRRATKIAKGVKLGREIKKMAGSGKGRLRRDKYNPPLESRPRQNPDALIGFKTCNKTYTDVGRRGIRKQAGRVRSARLAFEEENSAHSSGSGTAGHKQAARQL